VSNRARAQSSRQECLAIAEIIITRPGIAKE
jgi:hypothetical protein